jgi:uncharacterized membrane protein YgcG
MLRTLYTVYACIVLVVSLSVIYSDGGRGQIGGTGYRGGGWGGGGGYSGGGGHK